MAPEKAVKTTSLTMSCVWESGEFQTTGHSGPTVTAQFEGLVLVSTVFVDWWAGFFPPQTPCIFFVSCTVPFLCCTLHRAQIFWVHHHQAFWPKVGKSKVHSRLSCCCRIRARGSPSLHTRARQQRAKVRRLLRAVGGKQKRQHVPLTFYGPTTGATHRCHGHVAGADGERQQQKKLPQKGVVADSDPLEQTSHVDPSRGTARAAPWATSEPIGAQSLRESGPENGTQMSWRRW